MDWMSLLQQSGMGNSVGGTPAPGGHPGMSAGGGAGGMGAMSQQGGLLQLLMRQFGGGQEGPAPVTPAVGPPLPGGAGGAGGAAGMAGGAAPGGPSPMAGLGKGLGAASSAMGKSMMPSNSPSSAPQIKPAGAMSPFQPPQYVAPGQMGGAGGRYPNPFSR